MSNNSFKKIGNVLNEGNSILIFPHINGDGEVFVQVAETRNLTKVAERYHYSQSAISHALRAPH